jgi:hypothetical protein
VVALHVPEPANPALLQTLFNLTGSFSLDGVLSGQSQLARVNHRIGFVSFVKITLFWYIKQSARYNRDANKLFPDINKAAIYD